MVGSTGTKTTDSPTTLKDSEGGGSPASSATGASVALSFPPSGFDSADPGAASRRAPKGFLEIKIGDAELLLEYAAEAGIEVDKDSRNAVLKAKLESESGLTEQTAADLLAALTQITKKTIPVTAESLKASRVAGRETRTYIKLAVVLLALIVPYSIAAFVTSAVSDKIRQDVVVANTLAVKLSDELLLDPTKPLPEGVQKKDVIKDLQVLTSTMRTIYGRATLLNSFVLGTGSGEDRMAPLRSKGKELELRNKLELLPEAVTNLAVVANDKIPVYQDVRYFAENTQDRVSLIYGAIANHILPFLYALLGSCAFLARTLEQEIKDRTFTTSSRPLVHFLVAGIGGLVIGLFPSFNLTQGASFSPLAIAFVVGYAIDVFFSFLESFAQVFNRARGTSQAAADKPRP